MKKIVWFSIPFIAAFLMLGMIFYLARAANRATSASPHPATGGPNAPDWNSNIRYVGSTLKPRSNDVNYGTNSDGGCVYVTSGNSFTVWNVPLTLPQGAQVGFLRMYFYDVDPTNNIQGWFTKYDLYGSIVTEWHVASFNGGYAYNDVTISPTETIDYNSYSYVLNMRPVGSGSNLQFCGFRLFYTAPPIVMISGPDLGIIGISYTFTATVELVSTTLPLDYVWQASEQIPVTHTGGLTDTVSFTWDVPGAQLITVTASNPDGSASDTHVITITDVPIAGLVATNDSPTLLREPTTLSATIQAGTNVIYNWDFGDEESGGGQIITHTYPSVGIYTATVTATNSANSLTATTLVTISDVPISGLSASNDSPTLLGNATTLSATVTAGSNIIYSWDFGDGETGDGEVVTHTYTSAGIYTATITATNSTNTLTADTIVTITAPYYDLYFPLVIKSVQAPLVPTSSLPEGGVLVGLVIVGMAGRWKRRG